MTVPQEAPQELNAEQLAEVDERFAHQTLWSAHFHAPTDATRNALVEAYQDLVEEIVRRFARRLPRSVDTQDLVTAGCVGLMAAVTGFDPGRGVCFSAYSRRRVRGALLDELRQQDWLPRTVRQRIELHKRTIEALSASTGRVPLDREVADAMGIQREEYGVLFGTTLPGGPQVPRHDSHDEVAAALEVVPDTRHEAPGVQLGRDELLELVADRLTEQEYRVVYLKYWEELPMREIGQLIGLSESRVCKIHMALIERLRERLHGHTNAS